MPTNPCNLISTHEPTGQWLVPMTPVKPSFPSLQLYLAEHLYDSLKPPQTQPLSDSEHLRPFKFHLVLF